LSNSGKKHLLFLATTLALGGCQKAQVSGFDCPSAENVQEGIVIQCQDAQVVGTLPVRPDCTEDGETLCVANDDFKAADMTATKPNNILVDTTIAGVAGNLSPSGIKLCSNDGDGTDDPCEVDASRGTIAAKTEGLQEKIVVGQSIGNIGGTAVRQNIALCSANAEVGCKTNDDFKSVDADRLAPCAACIYQNAAACLTGGSLVGELTLLDATPKPPSTLTWRKALSNSDSAVLPWEDARAFCSGLVDQGKSDWRLPTQREIAGAFLVAPEYVGNVSVRATWSSTAHPDGIHAWFGNTTTGEMASLDRSESQPFYCVRP
jgi:hypothetical protein